MPHLNKLEILGQEDVKKLSKDLLNENKTVKLRLGGSSMYPNLLPGDIATISHIDALALKLGQIVIVEIGDSWKAHRLVGKQINQTEIIFITQGDSLSKPDANTKKAQLIGVVEQVFRAGKNVESSAFASWVYVTFRPFPQLIGRLTLRLKRKLRKQI